MVKMYSFHSLVPYKEMARTMEQKMSNKGKTASVHYILGYKDKMVKDDSDYYNKLINEYEAITIPL